MVFTAARFRSVIHCPNLMRLKKLILSLEIGRVKSLTCLHSRMCIRIYILIKKTKKKTRQKAEETKEEKRIPVKSLTGCNDIVCEFALCTFN